ncbi:hypothetical protein D3C81_1310740 [compost metagenome]
MADERPIGQQPPILTERPSQRGRRRILRSRLRQPEHHQQQTERREQPQTDEDRLPAGQRQQRPARGRRKNRRQSHHQHQLGEHLRRVDRIAQVAYHRTRHHHAGTASQGLDETRSDQPVEARRQRADERSQGEQRHAEQQRRAPAEAVGQRPVEQLTNGQPDEIGRQTVLHVLDVGGEGLRQRRKTRQVEIDRQRRKRRQGAKDQQET